jgi:hypothetical protein
MFQLLPMGMLALLLLILMATSADLSAAPGGQGDIERAIAAQEAHGEGLMAREDVVGIAVGVEPGGQAAIRLFVVSDNVVGLPPELDGVPVETVVTGMFYAYDPTDRYRPAPIGVSVGHPDITAGTIGARVRDSQGNVYVLSNNHVLANSNDAQIGDSMLQPGPFDGGTDPADKIGELYDFEPISFSSNNLMDAAIASSTTADLGNATLPEGYGVPGTNVVEATLGMGVQKCGRTTGCTTGQVEEINATVDVCYEPVGPFCLAIARFVQQFTITPGSFSAGGDSGSLIVTNDSAANPVGLLFAGSDTRTIANPIGPVLDRFNVTIDGSTDPDPTATATSPGPTATATEPAPTATDAPPTATRGRSTPTPTDSAPTATRGRPATATPPGATATSPPPTAEPGDISLAAFGYKVQGRQRVDLSWSGATSANVDIYRDGVVIATTANDGFYLDNLNRRGSGSYTYQLCEAGSTTECSNEATVEF